jgi:3-oxoacyl-[acyl-carrier-protein] synthase III
LKDFTNEDLPKDFDSKEMYSFYLNRFLNFSSIRIEDTKERIGLVETVLDKFFEESLVKPEEIDLLIFIHEDAYFQSKNVAHYTQKKYKLINSKIINLNGNQCANTEMALIFANQLLHDTSFKNILIINPICPFDENRIAGSFGIIGDGCGVLLVNNSNDKNKNISLIDYETIIDGEFHLEELGENQAESMSIHFINCIQKLINRNQHLKINQVIIQNGLPLLISQCLNKIGFSDNQIFKENIGRKGHFHSLDFIISHPLKTY